MPSSRRFHRLLGSRPEHFPPPGDAYNTFNLLIATMGFDWANTSLEMGVSGSFFGEIATWSNSVGWNALNWGGKGAAPVVPQVTVTQRFDKNWSAGIGMMANYNTVNQLQSPQGSSSAASGTFNIRPSQPSSFL